jgi:hypothetical protein
MDELLGRNEIAFITGERGRVKGVRIGIRR